MQWQLGGGARPRGRANLAKRVLFERFGHQRRSPETLSESRETLAHLPPCQFVEHLVKLRRLLPLCVPPLSAPVPPELCLPLSVRQAVPPKLQPHLVCLLGGRQAGPERRVLVLDASGTITRLLLPPRTWVPQLLQQRSSHVLVVLALRQNSARGPGGMTFAWAVVDGARDGLMRVRMAASTFVGCRA